MTKAGLWMPIVNPSLAPLAQFLAAAHGIVVNYLHSKSTLSPLELASACHLMKYMATTLEAASPYNPYGSPYRPPLDYAAVYGFDSSVVIVNPGNYRNGYFCYSQTGSFHEVIAYAGAGLASLASTRESIKEKTKLL